MASDGTRGRVVGTVMTGLLLGILLARTVSGAVAGLLGWRAVFVVAAVTAVAMAAVLHRAVPLEAARSASRYRDVLTSTAALLRDHAALRRSALLGALGFATFSVFWTTIAFHLSAAPFDYGDGAIGLLGLAGAAGAVGATAWAGWPTAAWRCRPGSPPRWRWSRPSASSGGGGPRSWPSWPGWWCSTWACRASRS